MSFSKDEDPRSRKIRGRRVRGQQTDMQVKKELLGVPQITAAVIILVDQ